MTAFRLNRRSALGLVAAPLLWPLARAARAQTLEKLVFQTDWRAQAEHGGYYQALAAGLYRKAGIDCEIRQGGPSLNISQLLLMGRVDMTMSNSFEAFTYVREDAPFFTIASIFQKDPQVLIGHPDTGFDGFEKLKGRTLLIGSGGRVTYWPYLRRKFGLSDDQLRPYTFNMAPTPPCSASPDNTMPRSFITLMAYWIRSSVCSGLAFLMRALADSIAGPPFRYCAQPSSVALTKRWMRSRFPAASLREIAMVVW